MNAKELSKWADHPETHREIVGNYAGTYALGVTDNPPAFLLRVEGSDLSSFPKKILIQGTEVPVIVRGDFEPPTPISGRAERGGQH